MSLEAQITVTWQLLHPCLTQEGARAVILEKLVTAYFGRNLFWACTEKFKFRIGRLKETRRAEPIDKTKSTEENLLLPGNLKVPAN